MNKIDLNDPWFLIRDNLWTAISKTMDINIISSLSKDLSRDIRTITMIIELYET